MDWLIGVLVCGLVVFSVGSSIREIRLYRKAVRGDIQYLVSRSRRNRRLVVSGILLIEAGLLYLGTFTIPLNNPHLSLLYWLPALMLMVVVMFLAFKDLRETRRDMDRIFQETLQTALKNAKQTEKR